ncbi:MAG TPA: class I SAM-dependent methyltransferase [Ignavibacteriaceae bacterium]|nr:class I SAM-dependent methyltransferase [Ignavibacteriaceae bacterium]
MYKKYFDANKKLWDKKTAIHADSDFYGLKEFKAGKSSLNFVELEALGDVKDNSLLHLQCHFGMDTLSWASLGAKVTGVDFSDEAIKLARSINDELKLNAEFICSNIYDLKENLDEKFDIVFTSYGTIGWLPDLDKWAEVISHFLKPGGLFFIAEFHPVIWMYDHGVKNLKYSYFNSGEPIAETNEGTYTDRNADIKMTEYGWNHSLDEVFNSLKNNGLKIESFNEYPFSFYNCLPGMVQGEDSFWRIKGFENILPLMYSIKALKS